MSIPYVSGFMFHDFCFLTLELPFLDVLSLFELLFRAREAEFELDFTTLIVQRNRNECQAFLGRFSCKLSDFPLGQEKFSRAGPVISAWRVFGLVGRDGRVDPKCFASADDDKRARQGGLFSKHRFCLKTKKHDACAVSVKYFVVK